MKDQESTTIMEVFVDQFVRRFGTPMQLHSDQGTNFQSNAFKEMCDYLSIDKTRTSSYRP
jgi:transposase InsO family protein